MPRSITDMLRQCRARNPIADIEDAVKGGALSADEGETLKAFMLEDVLASVKGTALDPAPAWRESVSTVAKVLNAIAGPPAPPPPPPTLEALGDASLDAHADPFPVTPATKPEPKGA